MKHPIAVVFVVLLVGSLVFGVWQYTQNQHLADENVQLRQQLDAEASELRQAEDEKRQLQNALNETDSKVAELQTQVSELEQRIENQTREIEKLREQLKIKNYITIGLTFLWNPSIVVDPNGLAHEIRELNSGWDGAHVYYFLYHASAQSFIPSIAHLCDLDQWMARAKALYPGPDIPITIIGNTYSDKWAGCAFLKQSGVALKWLDMSDVSVLTHELLHNFGFDDELLQHEPVYYIPSTFYTRIQSAARQYRMPLPPS
jgi:hypothetical protein